MVASPLALAQLDLRNPTKLPDNVGDLLPKPPGLSNLPKPPEFNGDPKEVIDEIDKAVQQGNAAAQKLGSDTLYRLSKSTEALRKANGDIISRIDQASRDGFKTSSKNAQGLVSLGERGWKKSSGQTRKDFKELTNAARAAERFQKRQNKADQDLLGKGSRKLLKGAPIGELWQTAVDHTHASDDNLAKATQESALLAAVAQAAATFYGGPAGAAAYAAWSTYHATGDANLAFRAGIIAALSNQAGASVSTMPTGTMSEVLKKAALAGSMGGIATAAAGGDEKAVKEAFLRSAGNVLIQAGNSKLTQYSPTAKNAVDTVQCVSARDVDCLSRTRWAKDAQGKLEKLANGSPYVAKLKSAQEQAAAWSAYAKGSVEEQKAKYLTPLSKIPQTDAIPLFNNRWVLTSTLGTKATPEEGVPTVVLTYVGPDAPVYSKTTYNVPGEKPFTVGSAPPTREHSGLSSAQAQPTTHATFVCSALGYNRTIVVTDTAPGCKSIYRKEGGVAQTLWNTSLPGKIPVCMAESEKVLVKLRQASFKCSSR